MTERPAIRTAFILGAGLGTRLRPLTEDCPKPLLPLGGRPIITYAMEHLRAAGVERFIVNTHHRAEAYARAFPRGPAGPSRPVPPRAGAPGHRRRLEHRGPPDENDGMILVYTVYVVSDLPLEAPRCPFPTAGRRRWRSASMEASGTSASTGGADL
jgi:NDP-sugar pyrophosphorylase family protein